MALRVGAVTGKATRDDVLPHRAEVIRLAGEVGLTHPSLRGDGAVIVHTAEAGYMAVARLSDLLSHVIGREVLVLTDEVPNAGAAQEL